MQILTTIQENILRDERRLLGDLRVRLSQFGVAADDNEILRQSTEQLDDFFLLVVVGEFNAGKSALINALLGSVVLKEGVTPTTTEIQVLRYGEDQSRVVNSALVHTITSDAELLKEMSIVDTPGTNAIIREHELITTQYLPRADLVLFTTSTDRPFTESERAFLQQIRDWGKKIIVVLNKIDILERPEDLTQIISFIDEHFFRLLGIKPEIFPISARLGLRGKQGEPDLWQRSRFGDLEHYIRETLDEAGRLQLKFLNPMGVGLHLIGKYNSIVSGRLNLLDEDVQVLEDVDRQLTEYRLDLERDFEFRMADIEKILYEMEERGNQYFDEMFRIGRVLDLLKRDRMEQEFAQKVVGDVPLQIDRKVTELVDWLVEADLRQWQSVMEHLAERRKQYQERIVGDIGVGSFHYDRERLIDGVGRKTQQVVDTFDRQAEARKIAEGAQTAVAAAAALEVGAVGLGAIVTAIATTAVADVTGILLASVVAALGLFVIPTKRRKAKQEMHQRVNDMRIQLVDALRGQFKGEISRSQNNVREAIGPYTRFVRSERAHLSETLADLKLIGDGLERLKAEVLSISDARQENIEN
jgi:small GTP-binding protein